MSLIEAMIATTLLSIALVVLAQVLTTAVTSNAASRKDTAAIALASQKVEELRSLPSQPPPGTDWIDQWGAPAGAARGAACTRRWTIAALPGSVLGTHVIEVRVEMPGRPVTSLVAVTRW